MKLDIHGPVETAKGPHHGAHGEAEQHELEQLKACPFCGGDAMKITNTHTPGYWVKCLICEASIPGSYSYGKRVKSPEAARRLHLRAFKAAIIAWNSRPADQA